ncbi:MAG: hypothetical protein HWE22_04405 [Flavobacteriales bacterium]|nr:hypothetical protein [Flavobacteriales bacterium]
MNRYLFLLLILFLSFSGLAQEIDSVRTDSLLSYAELPQSKITRAELVQLAPLCSDELHRVKVKGKLFKKKLQICYAESVLNCEYTDSEYTILDCEIDTTRLRNKTPVNEIDLDSILMILYDSPEVSYLAVCYSPRHGILMYDQDDELIGMVEICFECDRTLASNSDLEVKLLSGKAFNKLEQFFNKYGLK